MKQHDYNVIYAQSAAKALEILEIHPVNLLFSDIIMPDMDGYQLANIVRKKYPNIKIQLTSGYTDKHQDADNSHIHSSLLSKPYSGEILVKTIQDVLSK